MEYKSTKIMQKGLYKFGLLTLVLIMGFTLALSQKWYAVFFIIISQLIVLTIWYNGYKTGFEIRREISE